MRTADRKHVITVINYCMSLSLGDITDDGETETQSIQRISTNRPPLKVVKASDDELSAHQARLENINKASGEGCVWLKEESISK